MNSHAAIRGAPRARTRTWATTRIKSVDMLYLGAYTGMGVISDGPYYGLLRYFNSRKLGQPNYPPRRWSQSKKCELSQGCLASARTISTFLQLCGRRLEALTCRAHHLLALTCCEPLYYRYDGCNCCLPSS